MQLPTVQTLAQARESKLSSFYTGFEEFQRQGPNSRRKREMLLPSVRQTVIPRSRVTKSSLTLETGPKVTIGASWHRFMIRLSSLDEYLYLLKSVYSLRPWFRFLGPVPIGTKHIWNDTESVFDFRTEKASENENFQFLRVTCIIWSIKYLSYVYKMKFEKSLIR